MKNEEYCPNLKKFPYLKDLRDPIMQDFLNGKRWEDLSVEERYEHYHNYPSVEGTEAAYKSYLKYAFDKELGSLEKKLYKETNKDIPAANTYRFFFDKHPNTELTADLMNGWNFLEKSYKKLKGKDEMTDRAFLAFLKCCYTSGNMCISGSSFSPGQGASSDFWDYKLIVLQKKSNYNYWKSLTEDLGLQIERSLFLCDYFHNDRIIHIWDNQRKSLYSKDSSLFNSNQIKEWFGFGKDALAEYYSALNLDSASDISKYFYLTVFSNLTKLIIQRGYRIENNFSDKWTEDRACEVREAFKAVGLPEDGEEPADKNGLKYSIIGEWEE